MTNQKRLALLSLAVLAACTQNGGGTDVSVRQFLDMYNKLDQRLYANAGLAHWKSSTDVSETNTGARIGADSALAAFRGSSYIIDNARRLLNGRANLPEIEFRQLDKILLNAAESPGTVPDLVLARIEAEARWSAVLDGFSFCLERAGDTCAKPTNPNEIDEALSKLTDLRQRRKYWEVSKQTGPALKHGLAELRELRNRVARELGYSSYFHLQVADYGMTVDEMLQLMDQSIAGLRPLYQKLHLYTRRRLAERYKQPVPEKIPAHWLPNRWGQEWPGLVRSADLDPYFRNRTPRWIVEQAERFYTSLGMQALPKSFWEKSDLYQLPAGSARKKNTHASAWHIDAESDVRSLMSVIPNFSWFETSHHELGHVYYYIAYSNPKVPHVLREGMNRAFHEALGDVIGMAARQEAYLRQTGILPASVKLDPMEMLLDQALDSAVVFLPFSAGTMTRFEYELYEKNLKEDQFNKRWWELVEQYQGIVPPAPRGEEYCDACTKTHIIDDAAQYFDYAMAYLLKYQIHGHIARQILKQDPRACNYFGNAEVGRWLMGILELGATRDWRQVIREKTGEDIGTRAMLDYFQPLEGYLQPAGN